MMAEYAEEGVNQASKDGYPSREKMQIPAPAGVGNHERNRKVNEGGSSHCACFTPVETRMCDKNGDTADEQAKETDRRDPVGNADDRRVPRRIQALRASDCEPRQVRSLRHNHRSDNSTARGPRRAPHLRALGCGL